jgi:hypothetical protein
MRRESLAARIAARTPGQRDRVVDFLRVAARVHRDDEAAEQVYREGIAIASSIGDRRREAVMLANLSYIEAHRGEHPTALRLGLRALDLSLEIGHRMMAAWTLRELAGPALGLGHTEQAARLFGAAGAILTRLGVTRIPGDQPEDERVQPALTARLGSDRLERLITEGAKLSLDEAVALARAGIVV